MVSIIPRDTNQHWRTLSRSFCLVLYLREESLYLQAALQIQNRYRSLQREITQVLKGLWFPHFPAKPSYIFRSTEEIKRSKHTGSYSNPSPTQTALRIEIIYRSQPDGDHQSLTESLGDSRSCQVDNKTTTLVNTEATKHSSRAEDMKGDKQCSNFIKHVYVNDEIYNWKLK